MAKEKLQIILDAIWRGKRAVQQAGRDIKGIDKGVQQAQASWKKFAAAGAVAVGALVAVGAAAKVAFAEMQRGAALDLAAGQFDALTRSIGSTSSAMADRLKAASQGMVSNADLISGANEIMAGKLAKTEDQVVRLSSAAGALNVDMGLLAQTINNQSVLRLDNMGIAVEDVIPKFNELKAAGVGVKEAFTEALTLALEQKVGLLGETSLTTAGKLQKLVVVGENVRDAFSESFTRSLIPDINEAAAGSAELEQALTSMAVNAGAHVAGLVTSVADLVIEINKLTTEGIPALSLSDIGAGAGGSGSLLFPGGNPLDALFKTGEFSEAAAAAREIAAAAESADHAMIQYASSVQAANSATEKAKDGYRIAATSTLELGSRTQVTESNVRKLVDAMGLVGASAAAMQGSFRIASNSIIEVGNRAQATVPRVRKLISAMGLVNAASSALTGGRSSVSGATGRHQQRQAILNLDLINSTTTAEEEAALAADELANSFFGMASGASTAAEEMAALDAATGNFFDQARRATDFNPAEVFYEQALAAGASAEKLREVLIGTGLESAERAQEIYEQALQRQQITAGAQAFAAQGGISLEQAFGGGQGIAAADFSGSNVDQSSTVNVGGVTVIIQGSASQADLEMGIDNAFAQVATSEGVV